jgi:hypothetical protein
MKKNHEWMADGFCKWCHNTHRTDWRPSDVCETLTRLENRPVSGDGSTKRFLKQEVTTRDLMSM